MEGVVADLARDVNHECRLKTIVADIDAAKRKAYPISVETTVDIDESLLREAEAQARKQNKPLNLLIEDALRSTLAAHDLFSESPGSAPLEAGLEDNDPFFKALEEIRAFGRVPAPHRELKLS